MVDVVLIKGDNKNRGKWNIGIVTDFYFKVRTVKLRVGLTKFMKEP